MRVGKNRLCSALQLPLTLSMASFPVPLDGPQTSMFPLCPAAVQGNSASYRDMTHTVDFLSFVLSSKYHHAVGNFSCQATYPRFSKTTVSHRASIFILFGQNMGWNTKHVQGLLLAHNHTKHSFPFWTKTHEVINNILTPAAYKIPAVYIICSMSSVEYFNQCRN